MISIHALVKRATCAAVAEATCVVYFNPRPREEGDHITAVFLFDFRYFNPRPREEGDLAGSYWCKVITIFQSTPS